MSFLKTIYLLTACALVTTSCTLAAKKDGAPPPEKTSEVDRKGIRQTISKHQRHVSQCYGKSLLIKGNEQLKGTMMIFFKIGPDGRATEAKVNAKKSDVTSKTLSDCIIAGLTGWDFPVHPKGIDVGVNYPFVFRAAPPSNMQDKLDQFKKLKKGTY